MSEMQTIHEPASAIDAVARRGLLTLGAAVAGVTGRENDRAGVPFGDVGPIALNPRAGSLPFKPFLARLAF